MLADTGWLLLMFVSPVLGMIPAVILWQLLSAWLSPADAQ